ncbi:hypothetical protein M885DRAFT_526754, partial [Pelagophyceae sp. CCMP2097]
MDRFFGVESVKGRFVAQLTIPGGGQKYGNFFKLGQCETEVEAAAMYNCATMLVGKATKRKRFFNICPSLAAFKFHAAGKRAVTIKVANAFDKMNEKRAAAKKPLPPLYVTGQDAQGHAAREALRRRVLCRRRLPAQAERPEEAVAVQHEDRAIGAAPRGRGRRRRAGAGPDAAWRAPGDPALEPLGSPRAGSSSRTQPRETTANGSGGTAPTP